MKWAALVCMAGIALSDKGCGAGAGVNQAATGDGGAAAPLDAGALPQLDCGALGRHFFCEDFSGPMPGRFGSQSAAYGATSLDHVTFVSGPQALAAETTALTTGTRTFARLRKDFTVDGGRFVLAFAERVPAACVGPRDTVQTGGITMDGSKYYLYVMHGPERDSVVETSLSGGIYLQDHALSKKLPRDAWARVVLDVDLAQATMSLSLDGVPIMSAEPLKYPPTARTQRPSIEVGVLVDNGTKNVTPCRSHTDDVTFDVQP